jgi:hypothetical protein
MNCLFVYCRANDHVIKINGTDVTRVDHMVALQQLHASKKGINMVSFALCFREEGDRIQMFQCFFNLV